MTNKAHRHSTLPPPYHTDAEAPAGEVVPALVLTVFVAVAVVVVTKDQLQHCARRKRCY